MAAHINRLCAISLCSLWYSSLRTTRTSWRGYHIPTLRRSWRVCLPTSLLYTPVPSPTVRPPCALQASVHDSLSTARVSPYISRPLSLIQYSGHTGPLFASSPVSCGTALATTLCVFSGPLLPGFRQSRYCRNLLTTQWRRTSTSLSLPSWHRSASHCSCRRPTHHRPSRQNSMCPRRRSPPPKGHLRALAHPNRH